MEVKTQKINIFTKEEFESSLLPNDAPNLLPKFRAEQSSHHPGFAHLELCLQQPSLDSLTEVGG